MPEQNGRCADHLGNEYPSCSAMCLRYGVPMSTLKGRLSRGWSLEQALTVPTGGQGPKVNFKKPVKDHLGKTHASVVAMCEAWGIPEKVYWSRKRILKWPLERILTEPVHDAADAKNAVRVTDHTGQEHASISAMCRAWKIGLSTYRERRKRGWSVEQALTGQMAKLDTDPKPCRDHTGASYPSKNAMCRAWGTTRYAYESRLALGWDQERALTEGRVVHSKPGGTWDGIEFPASSYLALYLGLPKYAFQRTDADPEKLLPALAAAYWHGRSCGDILVQQCVEFPWFLVRSGGEDIVMRFDRILDKYHATDFAPLPATRLENPSVRAVRLVEWPWYLCSVDGGPCVLSYRDLIRLHHASNYGLSPAHEEKREGRTDI